MKNRIIIALAVVFRCLFIAAVCVIMFLVGRPSKGGGVGGGLSIPLVQSLPELPVDEKTRQSAFGRGLVIQFWNRSQTMLPINVHVESPTMHTAKNVGFVLSPGNGMRELGWQQGWDGAPGDTVSISSDGYQTAHYTLR